MTLWLARHATPCGVQGCCYGAMEVAAEAQHTLRAAQALALQLPPGVALYCSPRQRCQVLAQALQDLRPELHYRIDERLAEMDFGVWEGVPWSQIPKAEFDRWTADFSHYRFGGRESVQMVLHRVGAAWDAARADPARQGAGVVWLTHAGVARAATLLAQGRRTLLRASDWPQQAPAFGSSWRLALDGAGNGG